MPLCGVSTTRCPVDDHVEFDARWPLIHRLGVERQAVNVPRGMLRLTKAPFLAQSAGCAVLDSVCESVGAASDRFVSDARFARLVQLDPCAGPLSIRISPRQGAADCRAKTAGFRASALTKPLRLRLRPELPIRRGVPYSARLSPAVFPRPRLLSPLSQTLRIVSAKVLSWCPIAMRLSRTVFRR